MLNLAEFLEESISDELVPGGSVVGQSKTRTILSLTRDGEADTRRGKRVFRALKRFRWRKRLHVGFDLGDVKDEYGMDSNRNKAMIAKTRGNSVSLVDDAVKIPIRSRLKTNFVRLMWRRRCLSAPSLSRSSAISRASKNRKISAVRVIMRPFVKFRRKLPNSTKERPSLHLPISSLDGGRKFKRKRPNRWRVDKKVSFSEEKCRNWLDINLPTVSRGKSSNLSGDVATKDDKNRNKLKQKLGKIVKRFKKAGVVESVSLAKKMSSGDTGVVELIDLMEKLSLKSSQVLVDLSECLTDLSTDSTLSDITLPKPKLKRFFDDEQDELDDIFKRQRFAHFVTGSRQSVESGQRTLFTTWSSS